jgi:putative nucleotidyltransferase with HDIG domain
VESLSLAMTAGRAMVLPLLKLKEFDQYTTTHSINVAVLSMALAESLGMGAPSVRGFGLAGLLHDLGKIKIPQEILNKPGKLNPLEWTAIRRHTIIGEQILLAVPELRSAARLVRHSHERWDGGGYPDGLAGEDIPLGSRIVFCADAFHAIRSDRPYRAGRSAPEALAEIRANAGTQFDPAVVEALQELSAEIRAASNGHRPRTFRGRRLMALMLILSVGACSSAIARSGLLPQAKPPKASSDAAVAAPQVAPPPATGLAGAGFGGDSSDARGAAGDGAAGATVGGGQTLLQPGLLPPQLLIPELSPPAPGLGGTLGAAGPQDGVGLDDGRPGVRDHGAGLGRGKGRGSEHGKKLGRGHDKAKAFKAKHADREAHGNSARNSNNTPGNGNREAKGHAKKALGSSGETTSAGKSRGSAGNSTGSTGKPNATAKDKPETAPGNEASSNEAPKAPNAPSAPKPPKATQPAPPSESSTAPAAPTTASALGNGSGGGGGNGSSGGNGNG